MWVVPSLLVQGHTTAMKLVLWGRSQAPWPHCHPARGWLWLAQPLPKQKNRLFSGIAMGHSGSIRSLCMCLMSSVLTQRGQSSAGNPEHHRGLGHGLRPLSSLEL